MSKNILMLLCLCILSSCQSCSTEDVDVLAGDASVSVVVDGTPVTVHETLVSKWPTNKLWDGVQRDLSETETAYFTSFDYKEGQNIRIDVPGGEKGKKCVVRPREFGIEAEIGRKGDIELKNIPGPCQFVVEVDGYHNALHVFVNPAEPYSEVDRNSPDVIYYGPGKHSVPDGINVKSGQTLFIDEGAVLYSYVTASNVSDIKILGKGILDCSKFAREDCYPINISNSKDIVINGIVINDPTHWTALISNCRNVVFDNVKLIGCWRYNADGFDICNTSDVKIHNCFLRCFDDNIVIKGLSPFYRDGYNIIENIDVRNCVLWNDWGQALEIGAETVADEIRNVTYDSCYIMHFTFNAMDIQNTDKAYVHDIHYTNIYVEDPIYLNASLGGELMSPDGFGGLINIIVTPSMWSTVDIRGRVSDITYENIYYTGSKGTRINFSGYAEDADIKDLHISNCYINGKRIDKDYNYIKNKYVSNINIK